MTIPCSRCRADMYKKTTIMASNTKYDIYECAECGNEEQVCIGVNS
ncbi:MAG: hypothetical protein KKC75_06405 [Nanoarchaeota archaeon]|nr:hypothetical protein [Nanoarchaeota archaeon]MBU1004462.1 hypothetical protein [Nanoarchaeota archaeon]MBU1946268.1 hypothetical protein [Nanoarchaeota archaeon]